MQTIPRKAPKNLLEMGKLTHKEKMEIFDSRNKTILKFLADESFSSLENLAYLIAVPKQTSMRLGDRLEENGFVTSFLISVSKKTRPIRAFELTTIGLLESMRTEETLPPFKSIKKLTVEEVEQRLYCQQIRISLERQGYHDFEAGWKFDLTYADHLKSLKTVNYICKTPDNKKLAICYYYVINFKELDVVVNNLNKLISNGELDLVNFYFAIGYSEKVKTILTHSKVELTNFTFIDTVKLQIKD